MPCPPSHCALISSSFTTLYFFQFKYQTVTQIYKSLQIILKHPSPSYCFEYQKLLHKQRSQHNPTSSRTGVIQQVSNSSHVQDQEHWNKLPSDKARHRTRGITTTQHRTRAENPFQFECHFPGQTKYFQHCLAAFSGSSPPPSSHCCFCSKGIKNRLLPYLGLTHWVNALAGEPFSCASCRDVLRSLPPELGGRRGGEYDEILSLTVKIP